MPVRAVLVAVSLSVLASALPASAACRVADPTGTRLNVRSAPNGKIVGTFANGQEVSILAGSEFSGKKWVYVGDTANGDLPVGWVFGEFVVCQGGD